MDAGKWRVVFEWACTPSTKTLSPNPHPELRDELTPLVAWYRETKLMRISVSSPSVAYELSRLSDDAMRELYAQFLIERGEV